MSRPMKTLAVATFLAVTAISLQSAYAAPSDATAHPQSMSAASADLGALRAKVDLARKANPAVFDTVKAVRADMPNLDKGRRGTHALVGRILAGLGQDGLAPMLDMLVLREAEDRSMEPEVRVAWRVGLIDAIGRLRDPSALPYLGAILEAESESHVVFAAAQALARHGGDESTSKLAARALVADGKRASVVKALGECRREKAARALVTVLEQSAGDSPLAKTAVDALGMVGSSWVWAIPDVARTNEGNVTRELAAKALVAALPRLSAANRDDAMGALKTIDLPQTAILVQDARARATGGDRLIFDKALERLSRK